MNEQLIKEATQEILEKFKQFEDRFNNPRFGFLLLMYIVYLQPKYLDEPEISYQMFCDMIDIVRNNEKLQKVFQNL